MAGASKELSDAILVNPNDNEAIVEALHDALVMPLEEQMQHMEVLQDTVKKYNIHHWVDLFMSRLKIVKEEQEALKPKSLSGSTLGKLEKEYSNAQSRLIFLDYDGTLTPFHGNPSQSMPDEELLSILEALTADPKNSIVVISGRDKNTLDEWLGHFKVDIVGEHGVWIRKHGTDWRTIIGLENSWKKEIMPVLTSYVNRTAGSFIEEKDYSLVWHYRKVETGLGELRTRELASHMKYLSHDRNLQVLEGNMVVEIKNSEVNKGVAAKKWLHDSKAEFIMAIGDDWTDEDTFEVMPEGAYTIKVRESTSVAKYHLKSYKEVRKLLKSLA
jgi:trehalose 6-phosphate synthase/phosphatase